MDEALYANIIRRLDADAVDTHTATLVLAAFSGELDAVLGTDAPPAPPPQAPTAEPRGAYLKDLTVEGFRGIGPRTTLELTPGPSLTLVVGRNGSGKSSFVEALEVLLTGDSLRWARRPKVWRDGWRNLHHPDAAIAATVVLEGEGEVRLQRTWEDDTDLDASHTEIVRPGARAQSLHDLGWTTALQTNRPLLSYNELASMLDEGPSKLYDALSVVLGLEVLVACSKTLRDARLEREQALKQVRASLGEVTDALRASTDDRATRALTALDAKTWDLEAAEDVLTGVAAAPEDDLTTLRALTALEAPDPDEVARAAASLEEARARAEQIAGTDAGRARQTALLLEQALTFHADHGDGDCPVCGRPDALGASWREATQEEVSRLRTQATEADEAARALREALAHARGLLTPAPTALRRAAEVGVDATDAEAAWKTWASDVPDERLAAHITETIGPLVEAISILQRAAKAELDRREDAWRPVAHTLGEWIAKARPAVRGAETAPALKRAESWVKDVTDDIRNTRFAPIAQQAQEIWTLLRQQSNVELGEIRLEGSGTRRQVALDVTVDGVEGAALGVMSQGELNSLALALFLPRATMPESPFRFVVIDDPVQSMDPAKVDGLARALEQTARSRQIVVFTHDPRLPDAVRRLGIGATILDVGRLPGSKVSLVPNLDPVKRYLFDAFSLAKTERLPQKVAARVIPGFLRLAIEAACTETVKRRRLAAGQPHTEVEDELQGLKRLTHYAAMALFDDTERTADVMSYLNREVGPRAADAFKLCNKGAHEPIEGDLLELHRQVESICRHIQHRP